MALTTNQLVVGMFNMAAGGYKTLVGDYMTAHGATATADTLLAASGLNPQFMGTNLLSNTDFASGLIGRVLSGVSSSIQSSIATIVSNYMTANPTLTRGAVVVAVLEAVLAVPTTDATLGTAVSSFTSKVALADASTSTSTDFTVLSQVIGSTPTTTAGASYTLTTALDTPSSTSGDDTYLADNTGTAVALSGADQISAGAGIDLLKIYTKTGVANTLPTGMSGVEKVWINGTDQAVDVSGNSGITSLELNAAIAAGSYTATVAAGQKVTVSDQAAATTYTVTGASSITSQDLAVSKIGTTAANIISLTGTGVATVNLESSGTLTSTQWNTVQLKNATGVKVDTINITGSTALDLQLGEVADTQQFVSTGIKTINASAATGAVKVKINSKDTAGEADISTAFSYTGGSGNDTLDLSIATVGGTAVSATQLKAMTVNGGSGTDTLILSNTIATGTTSLTNLSGIEKVGIAAGNGTVNMANFNGATGIALSGTAAGGITVNALASTGTLEQGVSVDGANSLTVNAAGTALTDTLAWSVGSATAALGANTGAIAIAGYETITLTSQGAASTLGAGGITLSASAGGNEALNVVAGKDLTLAGAVTLSGASTSIGVSGSAAVTVSGVITAGTLTNTGTGAFTATAANKVLNFDASANTAAVSFTDSAATSAAILKFGTGGATVVGSGYADVITAGGGTNTITGGAGADNVTITHGTLGKVTTITLAALADTYNDTTLFANGGTTAAMDKYYGLAHGDKINFAAIGSLADGVTVASTLSAALTDNIGFVRGSYSESAQTFTTGTAATDNDWMLQVSETTGATNAAILLVDIVGTASITYASEIATLSIV